MRRWIFDMHLPLTSSGLHRSESRFLVLLERGDLLRDLVLNDREVFRTKTCNVVPFAVSYCHVQLNQHNIYPDIQRNILSCVPCPGALQKKETAENSKTRERFSCHDPSREFQNMFIDRRPLSHQSR